MQKNNEAKAAFQSELEKTIKQAEGAEENSSKKRAASSPPDDSIRRARKLIVGEKRKVLIRKKRLNSAPTLHLRETESRALRRQKAGEKRKK